MAASEATGDGAVLAVVTVDEVEIEDLLSCSCSIMAEGFVSPASLEDRMEVGDERVDVVLSFGSLSWLSRVAGISWVFSGDPAFFGAICIALFLRSSLKSRATDLACRSKDLDLSARFGGAARFCREGYKFYEVLNKDVLLITVEKKCYP